MRDIKLAPPWTIPLISVGVSLLLSVWLWATNDTINVDGIGYIDAANSIKQGGWNLNGGKALLIYPNIVGIFSIVTGLSTEISAYLINAIFTSVAIGIFSYISYEMSRDTHVTFYATLLILLNPHLNEYRAYVIRDPGFWMCYMLSLLSMYYFYVTEKKIYALLWGLALVVGALFRIDSFIYLLLLPIGFLLDGKFTVKKRILNMLTCYLVPILGLFVIYFLSKTNIVDIQFNAGDYFYSGNPLVAVIEVLSERADMLNQHVFDGMSDKQSLPALIAALLVVFLYKVVSTASLLTTSLTLYSFWHFWGELYDRYAVLLWYTLVSALALYGFVLHYYFLQGRYTLPLTFCFTLLAAPALKVIVGWRRLNWADSTNNKKRKAIYYLTLILLLFMLIDGVWSFGSRKDYIKEAGKWLEHNVPSNKSVFSNHPILFYYTGRETQKLPKEDWIKIEEDIKQGAVPKILDYAQGYIALVLDHDDINIHHDILQTKDVVLAKTFSNKKGDSVYIYKSRLMYIIDEAWSSRYKKDYVKRAGAWLKETIPDNRSIFTNNPVLFQYAGRKKSELPEEDWIKIEEDINQGTVPKILDYAQGYMALVLDHDEINIHHDILRTKDVVLANKFTNKKGDGVYIYKSRLMYIIDEAWSSRFKKDYVKRAGTWLKDAVPDNRMIFTNNPVLFQYTGRDMSELPDADWIKIEEDINHGAVPKILDYAQGYIALVLDRDEINIHHDILGTKDVVLANKFSNKKGDGVYIYKSRLMYIIDEAWSSRYRKDYIKQAGAWLKDAVPANRLIFSNNPVLFQYTGRDMSELPEEDWLRVEEDINHGTVPKILDYAQGYIALVLDHDEINIHHDILRTKDVVLVNKFPNKKGDSVYIYESKLMYIIDEAWSSRYKQDYVKRAGAWLKDNVSANRSIFTNNPVLFQYTGKNMSELPEEDWLRVEEDINQGTVPKILDYAKGYIALVLDNDEINIHHDILRTKDVVLINKFINKKGDGVYIYQSK